jgi:hypothetical protein
MMGACNTCRFASKGGEDEKHLYCHRNPPQTVPVNGGVSFPFPAVAPNGWCGEFRRSLKRLFRGHVQAGA